MRYHGRCPCDCHVPNVRTAGRPRSYRVLGFDSIEKFYAADPEGRRNSAEVDYGVHWTDPPIPGELPENGRRWRVSWVANTGEIYAVCHVADGKGNRVVRLYGQVPGREEAERFLEDWADHCTETGGLAWVEGLFAAAHAERFG
jgi:hypothetical protein